MIANGRICSNGNKDLNKNRVLNQLQPRLRYASTNQLAMNTKMVGLDFISFLLFMKILKHGLLAFSITGKCVRDDSKCSLRLFRAVTNDQLSQHSFGNFSTVYQSILIDGLLYDTFGSVKIKMKNVETFVSL